MMKGFSSNSELAMKNQLITSKRDDTDKVLQCELHVLQ